MSRDPYKYLDYYKLEDADLFFGRETEARRIVGEIITSQLLVLFSPSGSGKTSLLNAGVRPELERMGMQTVYCQLKGKPVSSICAAVSKALKTATNGEQERQQADPQDKQPEEDQQPEEGQQPEEDQQPDLHAFLTEATAKAQKPLVIFIDQFEEFFTIFRGQPELRKDFIAQLARVRYDLTLPVTIVLSLRDDYYVDLHEFRLEIPSIFENNANIRLKPFTISEARRAIEEPVKTLGYRYAGGLVDTIVKDLKKIGNGAVGIAPIILQLVCSALWQEKSEQEKKSEQEEKKEITSEHYKSCIPANSKAQPGVTPAQYILNNYLNNLLRKIPRSKHRLMVRVFEALKTVENTKRYRSFDDLKEILQANPARLNELLTELAELKILRHEVRQGAHWYEFKHDYLVKEVTDWLEAREKRLARRRLLYGITPGVVLFMALFIYFTYQYNTFYAGFVDTNEQEEIAVFRGFDPLGDGITTGLTRSDARNQAARSAFRKGFKLGFWKRSQWDSLGNKIDPSKAGKFLYKIGHLDASMEAYKRSLKESQGRARTEVINELVGLGSSDDRVLELLLKALNDEDSAIRKQVIRTLGELGNSEDRVIEPLLEALDDANREVQVQATQALVDLGWSDDRVLELLLEALDDTDSAIRKQVIQTLGELGNSEDRVIEPLLEALDDADREVQVQATQALVDLGRSDGRIVEKLIEQLGAPEGPAGSIEAVHGMLISLSQSNDRIVEKLAVVLRNANNSSRFRAGIVLAKLVPSNDQALGILVEAVKHPNRGIRFINAYALMSTDQGSQQGIKAMIEILLDVLNDQNGVVHSQVAIVLESLGAGESRVARLLIDILARDSRDFSQIMEVLVDLSQRDNRVIEILIEALDDTYGDVRDFGLQALINLGQRDERIVELLSEALLNHPRSGVRLRAVGALGRLGQHDDRVIEPLITALTDLNSNVRVQAAHALVDLDQSDDRVIEALVEALGDTNSDFGVRAAIVQTLGKLGQHDDRVIEPLITALTDLNSNVQVQAAQALVDLDQSDDRVIEALVEALGDTNSGVRAAIVQTLGKLGQRDDRVIEPLITALTDLNSNVRVQAAQALVDLDQSDDRVVGLLIETLSHPNSTLRSMAVLALGELGQRDDHIIEALSESFLDPSDWSNVAAQAKRIVGTLLYSKPKNELIEHYVMHKVSVLRTAGAQALARKDSTQIKQILPELEELKDTDKQPWVRLGAWEAYELIEQRLESEKRAAKYARIADSLFAKKNYSKAEAEYESTFRTYTGIIRVDSVKAAYAKFQQAHSIVKRGERLNLVPDYLETSFTYNPALKDTLRSEIAQEDNDWRSILEDEALKEQLDQLLELSPGQTDEN